MINKRNPVRRPDRFEPSYLCPELEKAAMGQAAGLLRRTIWTLRRILKLLSGIWIRLMAVTSFFIFRASTLISRKKANIMNLFLKVLDDIVFDILGLTEAKLNEVCWAVCELVRNRLEKARSV